MNLAAEQIKTLKILCCAKAFMSNGGCPQLKTIKILMNVLPLLLGQQSFCQIEQIANKQFTFCEASQLALAKPKIDQPS